MASWLSADGVVSLLSEAESDERDGKRAVQMFLVSLDLQQLATFREVEALEDAVHSSDHSTCNGSESDAEGES